jgi:hypothetical protein
MKLLAKEALSSKKVFDDYYICRVILPFSEF